MNENILKFYFEISKLKETIRTGWKEVGISSDKIESVADHICGCMFLALGIISEKKLNNLNLEKIFKMLLIKELAKIKTAEQSILINKDKTLVNKLIVKELTNGMNIQDELLDIYDETIELKSEESKFVLYVSKLESDLQAKKYELQGEFKLENALLDIEYYPDDIKLEIKPQVENASDGWILFDRRYYKNNELFESLSKDIQSINKIKKENNEKKSQKKL